MLAFDIETTGLSFRNCEITAACVYDGADGFQRTFIFSNGDSPEEFMGLLDNADTLCAFNGARFDIPFIEAQWGVTAARVYKWRVKLFDILEMSYTMLGEGFSLNRLLTFNSIMVKTSSGKEAIVMAKEGRWKDLGDYCMQDTIKTWKVSSLPLIKLPVCMPSGQVLLLDQNNKDIIQFKTTQYTVKMKHSFIQ